MRALTNRTGDNFELPSSGWYQICPIGEFPHADSGVIQVLDRAAIEAMANNFSPGADLLIDFDHFSHDPDERTTAAGWITALEARADGLWMKPRWSNSGRESLEGGDFRFISPTWLTRDCEALGNDRVRPLKLYDAGLTNKPNLSSLRALVNRANDDGSAAPAVPKPDASAIFGGLVNVAKREAGGTYETAWAKTKAKYPRLWEAVRSEHSEFLETIQ
jgi:phage I-like protein